jgi:hypothetical protein
VHHGKSYLHDLENGRKPLTSQLARRLDDILNGRGKLLAAVETDAALSTGDHQIEALELARRVSASDVSAETLDRMEQATDALAMAYATVAPQTLLPRVRSNLQYVAALLDARKTPPGRTALNASHSR